MAIDIALGCGTDRQVIGGHSQCNRCIEHICNRVCAEKPWAVCTKAGFGEGPKFFYPGEIGADGFRGLETLNLMG